MYDTTHYATLLNTYILGRTKPVTHREQRLKNLLQLPLGTTLCWISRGSQVDDGSEKHETQPMENDLYRGNRSIFLPSLLQILVMLEAVV